MSDYIKGDRFESAKELVFWLSEKKPYFYDKYIWHSDHEVYYTVDSSLHYKCFKATPNPAPSTESDGEDMVSYKEFDKTVGDRFSFEIECDFTGKAQARYLFRGYNDVYWCDTIQETIDVVTQELNRTYKNPAPSTESEKPTNNDLLKISNRFMKLEERIEKLETKPPKKFEFLSDDELRDLAFKDNYYAPKSFEAGYRYCQQQIEEGHRDE